MVALVALLALATTWAPLAGEIRPLLAGESPLVHPGATAAVAAVFAIASLLTVPTTVLAVGAALVFGAWSGFGLSLAGALASAAVAYGAGRVLPRESVRAIGGPRLNPIVRRLRAGRGLALASVRLVPAAPFTLVNLVAGAVRMPVAAFAIGTVASVGPGLLAMSLLAAAFRGVLREPRLEALVVAALATALVLLATRARR
jgi:uncharacterized membrane protein YdjX (TVP38/TMEM64 family)